MIYILPPCSHTLYCHPVHTLYIVTLFTHYSATMFYILQPCSYTLYIVTCSIYCHHVHTLYSATLLIHHVLHIATMFTHLLYIVTIHTLYIAIMFTHYIVTMFTYSISYTLYCHRVHTLTIICHPVIHCILPPCSTLFIHTILPPCSHTLYCHDVHTLNIATVFTHTGIQTGG